MPGPFIDQPDSGRSDGRQRRLDVVNAVTNMMDPLAPSRQELAHRRVGTERLEQLDVARSRAEHRLANPLCLVHFDTDNIQAERAAVPLHGLVEVAAGDADMIHPGQQCPLLRRLR